MYSDVCKVISRRNLQLTFNNSNDHLNKVNILKLN